MIIPRKMLLTCIISGTRGGPKLGRSAWTSSYSKHHAWQARVKGFEYLVLLPKYLCPRWLDELQTLNGKWKRINETRKKRARCTKSTCTKFLLVPLNMLLLCQIHFFIFIFSIPFIIFALLYSLPPRRNSDPGSHSRLFSPPTHYGSCVAFFFPRRFQLFPCRLASNCAYPRSTLSAVDRFLFLQINSKSRYGGVRIHGPTLASFEGYCYYSPPGWPANTVRSISR